MFASLVSVVALASFVAAQVTVNTPNTPVECVPTQISWSGGTAPYTLLIQEPDANGTPVQIYSGLTGTSFSWSTNITSGTSIGITVRDNTGASGQTAPVTITAGTTDSCLTSSGSTTDTSAAATGSSTSAAAGTSSVSTPATASSTSSISVTAPTVSSAATSGAATSGSATSAASHSSAASSGSSSAASTSASATGGASSGAGANTVAMGALGFVAAVAAVLA